MTFNVLGCTVIEAKSVRSFAPNLEWSRRIALGIEPERGVSNSRALAPAPFVFEFDFVGRPAIRDEAAKALSGLPPDGHDTTDLNDVKSTLFLE